MAPSQHTSSTTSSRASSWKRSFSALAAVSMALFSASTMIHPVSAQRLSFSSPFSKQVEYFKVPSRSTTWHLGDTVNIKLRHSLSKRDSNNTMLYLEYTTRACQGSRPDEERTCDNRATKITSFGQIPAGSDTVEWTIPTTLDLQLSRGRFHIYDYNGHSSESFLIRPRIRHYPRVGMADQQQLL
ncbi:hypothetical protein EDD11_004121 [Mortierella claussenii]|nr:hypothetical protein EDD11_004121 [Mortierella claussenii]